MNSEYDPLIIPHNRSTDPSYENQHILSVTFTLPHSR